MNSCSGRAPGSAARRRPRTPAPRGGRGRAAPSPVHAHRGAPHRRAWPSAVLDDVHRRGVPHQHAAAVELLHHVRVQRVVGAHDGGVQVAPPGRSIASSCGRRQAEPTRASSSCRLMPRVRSRRPFRNTRPSESLRTSRTPNQVRVGRAGAAAGARLDRQVVQVAPADVPQPRPLDRELGGQLAPPARRQRDRVEAHRLARPPGRVTSGRSGRRDRLRTVASTRTRAGQVGHASRGSAWAREMSRPRDGTHRDLAVDAAEVPPAAVAPAVEAGAAPVGQVVGGAQRRHAHRQRAPPGRQVDLERQVVAHVAAHAAAVDVHRGGVPRALEAGDPARPAGSSSLRRYRPRRTCSAWPRRRSSRAGPTPRRQRSIASRRNSQPPVQRRAAGLALAHEAACRPAPGRAGGGGSAVVPQLQPLTASQGQLRRRPRRFASGSI